jgi:hypothetical protein
VTFTVEVVTEEKRRCNISSTEVPRESVSRREVMRALRRDSREKRLKPAVFGEGFLEERVETAGSTICKKCLNGE